MSEETQVSQETSNSEATPALEATSTESTSQPTESGKPEKATTEQTDGWEYNGDRNAVPEPFKKYVAGLDRYVSKKDQARAELEKQVKNYESKLASFNSTDVKPSNTGAAPVESLSVTQEESEAIMLGDATVLQKVIQREVQRHLKADVDPKTTEIREQLSQLTLKQKEIDAAETIKAFTDINPDFDELLKSPVGDYMVNAARNGMDLETIYKNAKAVESHFANAAEARRKSDMEKKKNGSVVGKSVTGDPAILYAENEEQAKRLAIELTLKGDKRQVQIKDRKR